MARKRRPQSTRAEGSRERRASRWGNIDCLIQGGGDVTLGQVGPIECAATAADGDQMLAALVRRKGESFEELLDRLDAALQRRWDTDELLDEING
jgi:hypothetical protein